MPQLPADLDVVVHCAGDVSFDPPIDQAFTTNVIGTKALMDRMLAGRHRRERHPDARCRTTCTSPPRTPQAARRGAIPEAPARARHRLRRGDRWPGLPCAT